jgi:hypothetical protein
MKTTFVAILQSDDIRSRLLDYFVLLLDQQQGKSLPLVIRLTDRFLVMLLAAIFRTSRVRRSNCSCLTVCLYRRQTHSSWFSSRLLQHFR